MSTQGKPNKPTTVWAKDGVTQEPAPSSLALAAMGLEAEFSLFIDGKQVVPEKYFKDPRDFVRGPLMHRVGTSYHLPPGGALYFDTGVVEIATPVIEIDRGCSARAGRQLWENIHYMRRELDAWERRTGHDARLEGFSTHYNISFELPKEKQHNGRSIEQLAYLLVYLLPIPVMLLAANRRSTGIGVRPRGDRIEITADFTPSAALMISTATLIVGIVREVMTWPSFDLEALRERGLPLLEGFEPMPHTSRKGWLARHDCFPQSPFTCDIDAPIWSLAPAEEGEAPEAASLRDVAIRIARYFRRAIRRVSDPFTIRMLNHVFMGRAPSLLELDDRPDAYDDVGRLCLWDDLFPEQALSRSRYERVLIRAISGRTLRMHGDSFEPVGLRGWSEVVFRRASDRTRHRFSIDYLIRHLDDWES